MGVGERVVIVNGLEMARNVFSPSSFLSIGEEGVSFWIREERVEKDAWINFSNCERFERISAMNENLILGI